LRTASLQESLRQQQKIFGSVLFQVAEKRSLETRRVSLSRKTISVPHTDGSLKPVSGANDRFIAMATDDAVAGDLVQVEVVVGQATATES
jgi:hypothetical protein